MMKVKNRSNKPSKIQMENTSMYSSYYFIRIYMRQEEEKKCGSTFYINRKTDALHTKYSNNIVIFNN